MTPAQIDCARRRVVENFLQGHKIWSIKTRVSTGLLWLHHTYCIQYPYSLHLESTKTVIRIWFREFLELLFQNDQSVLIIFYAKYVPCTFRDIWWDHNVKTGSPIWNHFMANTKYYFFNQCSCDYKIKKKKKVIMHHWSIDPLEYFIISVFYLWTWKLVILLNLLQKDFPVKQTHTHTTPLLFTFQVAPPKYNKS